MTSTIPGNSTSEQNFISRHLPTIALVIATIAWGMGFTWAKLVGSRINQMAKLPDGSFLGPVMLLAFRFIFGSGLWFLAFAQSRRNWQGRSLLTPCLLGLLLSLGLISQHCGLDRTSEAVSAFLTNLTVIFVPIIIAIMTRKLPARMFAVAVITAAVGIFLLTGAQFDRLGVGELLGATCSVLFAFFIIAVDRHVTMEDSYRSTGLQFATVGIICFLFSMLYCLKVFDPIAKLANTTTFTHRIAFFNLIGRCLSDWTILGCTGLLILLPTITSFGLMMRFQPCIDPTRAALIYLFEPIVAGVWGAMFGQSELTGKMLAGASLIVIANLLASLPKKAR